MTYSKLKWRSTVQNGQIPRTMLAEIYPEQWDADLNGPALMHPEAAAAMSVLLQQAWEDGITQLRVKYSYRPLSIQLVKWANYKAGGNLAAVPGTSNHGWAVAVDFTGLDEEAINWLRRHAKRYGFVNDVPSENWHYTYQEGLWNGDEMTEEQAKAFRELKAYRAGQLWLDEHWTKEDPNPEPPKDRDPAFYEGVRVLRRAYNRPRVTTP